MNCTKICKEWNKPTFEGPGYHIQGSDCSGFQEVMKKALQWTFDKVLQVKQKRWLSLAEPRWMTLSDDVGGGGHEEKTKQMGVF